mgnify:CR=1 FL=1
MNFFSMFSFFLQADSILLQSEKIYAVLAVISVIFVAFIVMMIRTELKVRKLEK